MKRIFSLILVLMAVQMMFAAKVTVTNTSDDVDEKGSLRWACETATSNDTIVFKFSTKGDKTIHISSYLTTNASIDGSTWADSIIIEGTNKKANSSDDGFQGVGAFVKKIVVKNCYAGFHVLTSTAKSNAFYDCIASNCIMGFYCNNSKDVSIIRCKSLNNDNYGISSGSTVLETIEDCHITGNKKAGIYGQAKNITGCRIYSNGVGIDVVYNSDLIEDCVISGNTTYGIHVSGKVKKISNNVIGLTEDQKDVFSNDNGIYIQGSGVDILSGNVISGNLKDGINSSLKGSDIGVFMGNYIGTNKYFVSDPKFGNGANGYYPSSSSSYPKFSRNYFGNNAENGIKGSFSGTISFEDCYFGITPDGDPMPNGIDGLNVGSSNMTFKNCHVGYNEGSGINVTRGTVTVNGGEFIGNKEMGLSLLSGNPNFTVEDAIFDSNGNSAISFDNKGYLTSSLISNTKFLHTNKAYPAYSTTNPYPAPEFTSCKMTEKTIDIVVKVDTAAKAKIELFYTSQGEQTAEMLVDSFYTKNDGTLSISLDKSKFAGKSIIGFTATATYGGKYTSPLSDVVCPEMGKVDLKSTEFYVKVDGYGDGSSWEKAMSPQTFAYYLPQVKDGSTFHVAEGTYYPMYDYKQEAPKNRQQVTFFIKSNVTINGGYPDTAKTGDAPNHERYLTIFSGDFNDDDVVSFNSVNKSLSFENTDDDAGAIFSLFQSDENLTYYSKTRYYDNVLYDKDYNNIQDNGKNKCFILNGVVLDNGINGIRIINPNLRVEVKNTVFQNISGNTIDKPYDDNSVLKFEYSNFESCKYIYVPSVDSVIIDHVNIHKCGGGHYSGINVINSHEMKTVVLINDLNYYESYDFLEISYSFIKWTNSKVNDVDFGERFCSNSSLVIENSQFINAPVYIRNLVDDVYITNCVFKENANWTLSLTKDDQRVYISRCNFSSNGGDLIKGNYFVIDNCVFEDNDGTNAFSKINDLYITSSKFKNNTFESIGNDIKYMTMKKCLFSKNQVGKGFYVYYEMSDSCSKYEDNECKSVFFKIDDGPSSFKKDTIVEHRSSFLFESSGEMNVDNCLIKNNDSYLFNQQGNFELRNCEIIDNFKTDMDSEIPIISLNSKSEDDRVNVFSSIFKDNKYKDCVFLKNEVPYVGFKQCVFESNEVSEIFNSAQLSDPYAMRYKLNIEESTFGDNITAYSVIHLGTMNDLYSVNSTYVNNTTDIAVLYGVYTNCELYNNTILSNEVRDNHSVYLGGNNDLKMIGNVIESIVLSGYNDVVTSMNNIFLCDLSERGSKTVWANEENAISLNASVCSDLFDGKYDSKNDKFEASLKDNGGFTPTVALKSDKLSDGKSIRFPRLDDVLTDQRGESRLDNTCMGAYEISKIDTVFVRDTIVLGETYAFNDKDITPSKIGWLHDTMIVKKGNIEEPQVLVLCVIPKKSSYYYVKKVAEGNGTGSSWKNAMSGDDFAFALPFAAGGTKFYFAEGVYNPIYDAKGEKTEKSTSLCYRINSNVTFVGGYPANAQIGATADPENHPTIFSGDIKGDDKVVKGVDDNGRLKLTYSNRGDNSEQLFVLQGKSVTFNNVNFEGATSYGIIDSGNNARFEGKNLSFRNCGYAVYYPSNDAVVFIEGSTFENNKSGCLYTTNAWNTNISTCSFTGNTGYIAYSTSEGMMSFDHVSVIGNNAQIYSSNKVDFKISNSEFIDNDNYGSLIFMLNNDKVSQITNSLFKENKNQILEFKSNTSLDIDSCSFIGNTNRVLYAVSGSKTSIGRSVFEKNIIPAVGDKKGELILSEGSVGIKTSSFFDNECGNLAYMSSVDVENSTFVKNDVNSIIYQSADGDKFRLVNNTIISNKISSYPLYAHLNSYLHGNIVLGNKLEGKVLSDKKYDEFELSVIHDIQEFEFNLMDIIRKNPQTSEDDDISTYIPDNSTNLLVKPREITIQKGYNNCKACEYATDKSEEYYLTNLFDGTLDSKTGTFTPTIKNNRGATPTVALKSDKLSDGTTIRFPRLENVLTDQRGVSRFDETCMGAYELGCVNDTTLTTDTIYVGEKIYGQTFTKVGVHDSIFETLTSSLDCDSVVMHKVVVKPDPKTLNYYVKTKKVGDGDGRDWDNAMDGTDFATYLPLAPDGAVFYVAAGTYSPVYDVNMNIPSDFSDLCYAINSSVTIRGGYPAGATGTDVPSEPKKYETIINGDIKGDAKSGIQTLFLAKIEKQFSIYGLNFVHTKDISSSSAAIISNGMLTVKQCVFDSCFCAILLKKGSFASIDSSIFTKSWAPSINVEEGASLTTSNSKFEDNVLSSPSKSPVYFGAAIYSQGVIDVNNCIFRNNKVGMNGSPSSGGGAIAIVSVGSHSDIIKNSYFENNVATHGGAIYLLNGDSVLIEGCTFTDNYTLLGQGNALFSTKRGNNTRYKCLSNNTFYRNDDKEYFRNTNVIESDDITHVVNNTIVGNHVPCFNLGNALIEGNIIVTDTTIGKFSGIFSKLNVVSDNISVEGAISVPLSEIAFILDGSYDMNNNSFVPTLKNNGGFTPTVALKSDKLSDGTSIRFPRLENVLTDQRGVSRLDETCMGAYELGCVNDTTFSTDTIYVGEKIFGQTFTKVGVHDSIFETLQSINGCDSVVMHKVVVKPDPKTLNYYVKTKKVGDGDGRDWDNAMDGDDFAMYLPLAPDGAIFYVAAGTYSPVYGVNLNTPSNTSGLCYTINSSVTIRGGYPANATGTDVPSEPKKYKTIFDGDIDGDDEITETKDDDYLLVSVTNRKDNSSYMFFSQSNKELHVTLDGISVKSSGGAVYILNPDKNVKISNSEFTYNDNAVYMPYEGENLEVYNSKFSKNFSNVIYMPTASNLTMDSILFENNQRNLVFIPGTSGVNPNHNVRLNRIYAYANGDSSAIVYSIGHDFVLSNSEFKNNRGLFFIYDNTRIDSTLFENNYGDFTKYGVLGFDINECSFIGNKTNGRFISSMKNGTELNHFSVTKSSFKNTDSKGLMYVVTDSIVISNNEILDNIIKSTCLDFIYPYYCEISNNNIYGNEIGGCYFAESSHQRPLKTIIRGNSIWNNKTTGSLMGFTGGTDPTFYNNTIVSNQIDGEVIYNWGSNSSLFNNTIVGNELSGTAGYVFELLGNELQIKGNIILGNKTDKNSEMLGVNGLKLLKNNILSFVHYINTGGTGTGCMELPDNTNVVSVFKDDYIKLLECDKEYDYSKAINRNEEILTTLFEGKYNKETGLFTPTLKNNGGFTPTVALKSDKLSDGRSIRFPRLENVLTDQRGVERLDSTCMGAYEMKCTSDTTFLRDTIICGESFNDSVFTQVGRHDLIENFTNRYDCDSVVLLNLFVKPVPNEVGYFVKMERSGKGDGSSWDNAMNGEDFAAVLNLVEPNSKFHIAEGVYLPVYDIVGGIPSKDYDKVFFSDKCVSIDGGYSDKSKGTELNADPAVYKTILSGDNEGNTPAKFDAAGEYADYRKDDCHAIFQVETKGEGSIDISGIEFFGSYAHNSGGSAAVKIQAENASFSVERCTFTQNNYGMMAFDCSGKVNESYFYGNYYTGFTNSISEKDTTYITYSTFENGSSGVLNLYNQGNAVLSNNTILNDGKTMFVTDVNAELYNNTILANISTNNTTELLMVGNIIKGSVSESGKIESLYNLYTDELSANFISKFDKTSSVENILKNMEGEGNTTQNNGGFTPTIALKSDVLADGTSLRLPLTKTIINDDQRGVDRLPATCIGSYETIEVSTVDPFVMDAVYDTICGGLDYVNGNWSLSAENLPESGDEVFKNIVGSSLACDTVEILYLHIIESHNVKITYSNANKSVCADGPGGSVAIALEQNNKSSWSVTLSDSTKESVDSDIFSETSQYFIFDKLMPGTYSINVHNTQLCSTDTTFNITVDNIQKLHVEAPDTLVTLCRKESTADCEIKAYGYNSSMTIYLDDIALSENLELGNSYISSTESDLATIYVYALRPGIHHLTAVNSCGDKYDLKEIMVIAPDELQMSISDKMIDGFKCSKDRGFVEFAISGGFEPIFSVTSDSVNVEKNVDGQSTIKIENLPDGKYHFLLRSNLEECSDSLSETVYVSTPDTLNLSLMSNAEADKLCEDGTLIKATVTGENEEYLFTWVTPQGDSIVTKNSVLNNVGAGTYICKVTDSNNCSSVYGTVKLSTVDDLDQIEIKSISQQSVCFNEDAFELKVDYSNNNKQQAVTALLNDRVSNKLVKSATSKLEKGALILDKVPSGHYNLIVRYGTADCEISSDKFVDTAITVVRNEAPLSINNPVIYPQTCYSNPDGKVVITVNGWGKYNASWNNKSTTPSKIENSVATFEFEGLGGGEYHFVVKDECGGSDSVVISSKQMPIPVPVSMNVKVLKDTVYCAREKSGEIELNLTGGIEGHSSLTLDGEEIKYLSTQKISTLGKGIHKIVYTSENEACSGDSKYISFKIKGPDTLFAQFGLTGFDCDAAEMFADVTGETAPYIYQWSDGLTTSRPSFRKKSPYPVESGKTYSLKVKDFAGCDSMVTTFTVPTADVLPQLLLDPIGYPEKCHNGNNGSADIWFSTGNINLPFGMVVTVVVSKNGVVVKQIEKTLSNKEAYLVQLVDCLAPGLYDVTVHYGNAKCVMEDKSVSGTFEVEALKKLEYKSDLTVLPQTCETPNGSVTVLVDGWNNSHTVTLYRKVSFNILFSRLNFDIPVFSQHMSPKVEGQLATLTIGALPSAKYYLQVSDVCGNKIKTKTFFVEKKLTEVSDLKIEKVLSCFNRPNGVASFNVTGWTNQHVCKVARVENDKYVDVILPNPVTIDEENKKAFFRIDTLKTGTWHVRVVNECGEDKVYDKITMHGIKKYELIVEPLSRLKLDCPYDTNGMILLTAKGGRPYAPILAGFEEKVTYQVPDGYTYFEKEKIVYEEKKEPEMEMYVIKDTLVIGVGDTTFSERYDYKIKYDEDGNIVYRTWIDTVVVFEKDSMPKYKNEDSIRFVDISSKVKTLNVYMNGLLDFRKYALVSNLKPGNYSLIFKSDLEGCLDSVETKVSVVAPKNMIFDKEILPISCSPRHDAEIAIRPHREGYVYNGNLVVQPSSSYMYYHPVGVLKDGNFKLLQATDEIGILDAKIAVAANEVKNDGLYYIMLSNNFSHQQYTPVPRQDDDFIYGDPSIVSVEWFKEVNGNLNKLNMLRADSCTDFMDDTSFVKRYYLNGSEIGDLPVWGESPFGNSFELIPSSDNFDACYIPGVQTVANLSAGQYVVRVTDNKGCVYNEKIELKNPQEALKIDSVIFNAEDAYCDPLARRIRVHASGGWGSYTYLFTNEDEPESYGNSLGYKTTEDSIVISQDNIVRSGFAMSAFLDPGLYKVMVMDKFGCIVTSDEKYRVKGDISIPKKDTIVPKCPRMDVVVPLSLNGSVDGTLFDVDVYTRQDTLYTPITSPFAKDLKVENGAITLIVPSKEKGINKYGFFVHESGKECGGGYVEIIVNDTLPKMVFSLKELYSSLCYSENTGKVDLYAQGGVLPYSINIWKDKDGEKVQYGNVTVSSLIEQKLNDTVSLYYTTVEDLDAGVFNMTLVDSRECPQDLESPITIIQPEPLKADFFTSGICPHVSQVDSDNLIEAVKNDGWSPEEGNGFVFAQNVTGGVAPYSFSCEGKTSDPDDTRLAISVNGELGKVYDCVVYDSNNCEYKGTAEFKDAPFQEPIIDFVTSQWSKESDIITFIDICYTKENDTEKLILSDSVTYEFNDEVLELLDKRMFIYDIEGGSVNAQTLIKERGSRSFEDSFFDANFTRLVDKDQAKRMNFAQLKREYKTTSTGSHYMESLTDVVSTPVKMTAYFSGCAYEMSCSKIYIAPSAYNIGDKVGVLPRGGEIVDFYVAPTVAENTSTAYITLDLQPGNVANTTVDLQLFSMDGGTLVQTVPLKPGNKDASGYYKIEYMFSGLDNLASGVYIVIMNVNGKDKRYSYIIKK